LKVHIGAIGAFPPAWTLRRCFRQRHRWRASV